MLGLRDAKAAVLYIFGQSNAHAHKQMLTEEEKITAPLKNVFTLDRDPNQKLDAEAVVWSGFTSAGYNLGETQDHTASFAYYTARTWQKAVDRGAGLPDLYIVQLSIGAQGVFRGVVNDMNGMWNPEKEPLLIPGPLSKVNISLFPFALHLIRLVDRDLRARFGEYYPLGMHWFGSEEDEDPSVCRRADFTEVYDSFFDRLMEAAGKETPLVMYDLRFLHRAKAENLEAVNELFRRECGRFPHAWTVDPKDSPDWDDEDRNFGIFADDNVHYLAKTQSWFSKHFLLRACGEIIGEDEAY